MKKQYFLAASVILLVVMISSCHKDKNINIPVSSTSRATRSFSSDQIRNYFTLMCTVTKNTKGFFPTQAARAYGYVGVAAYEAVVNGIPGGLSLSGQLNGINNIPKPSANLEYNWAISSNAAIAEMMRDMFDVNLTAANRAKIDSTEAANLAGLSAGVNADAVTRSVQYGKAVTAAIYKASISDGAHQSYLDPFQLPYTLPAVDYCWEPTSVTSPNPVSPKWGDTRPFMAVNISNTSPVAPTTYSTAAGSDFYKLALDVYNQVKNNTAEQIAITKYWADDPFNTCTPAGHTFNILSQLLKENSATLEKASVAYAQLSIAENDAFISCWKSKYQYVLIRPVTYIQKNIDANFKTVIGTPPFPAYTSGHSYESGAASMIFNNLFTDGSGKYDFTDYSQLQYGYSTRHYSNFNDMAQE
ncbi:MAG: vanadium-dependent haloperoxidase, partial [Bacteroidota bacterium]|nr:vanadium-dependent haloperoxidase [Bacteroidota bacterium]